MKAKFILAGAVFTVLAFLTSCTTTKDLRAVKRVTASRSLLNEVKPYVDSLWPCTIDTATVFLPGKIDSIPYPIYNAIILDTNIREEILDSIKKDSINVDKKILVAYNKGFKDATRLMWNIKVPVFTPDTLLLKQASTRRVDIANTARISAEEKATIKSAQADIYKRERNILAIVSITAIVALLLSIFYRFKL